MSHFICFSYPNGAERISTRIRLDGSTSVVVTDNRGALIRSADDTIDVRDARRLIEDVFSISATLPNRPDGDLFFSVGEGAERRDHAVSEYDLPERGLQVARIVRMISNDVLAGYKTRSPRRQGGPTAPAMTAVAFVGWTLAFSLGFVVTALIGQLGLIVGVLSGPYGFAVSNSVGILLMAGSYYGIGEKFGEQYRGYANVWLPAVAATLPFVYLWMEYAGAGSFFSLIFMCLMPFVASRGAASSY